MFGLEDPDALDYFSNLELVSVKQGKYEAAETMYRRAL